MASIEQLKADQNVLKLAEDQKVCTALYCLFISFVNDQKCACQVQSNVVFILFECLLYRNKKKNSMLKSFSLKDNWI